MTFARNSGQTPAMDHVAIIFHTGSAHPRDLENTGDAFLTYPIAFNELFAVIQGCVYKRRAKMVSASSAL
jgi:hypothetical protein